MNKQQTIDKIMALVDEGFPGPEDFAAGLRGIIPDDPAPVEEEPVAMNIYHVQDDDRPMYVLAQSWTDALERWQDLIQNENPGECLNGATPNGIALLAEKDDVLTWGAIRDWTEGKKLREENERLTVEVAGLTQRVMEQSKKLLDDQVGYHRIQAEVADLRRQLAEQHAPANPSATPEAPVEQAEQEKPVSELAETVERLRVVEEQLFWMWLRNSCFGWANRRGTQNHDNQKST
jgi:hypothetical protein